MWLSSNEKGLTLVEILVSIAIISILASVAMPYAEVTIRRNQELELRRSLRQIRTAIDDFHSDWQAGKIPLTNGVAGEYGYPSELEVLVSGIQLDDGRLKRYLRRIPRNPLYRHDDTKEQWLLRGYEDAIDNQTWNGRDVYDVKAQSEREALDGSWYRDW
jgi:general secretion pathway protein G